MSDSFKEKYIKSKLQLIDKNCSVEIYISMLNSMGFKVKPFQYDNVLINFMKIYPYWIVLFVILSFWTDSFLFGSYILNLILIPFLSSLVVVYIYYKNKNLNIDKWDDL